MKEQHYAANFKKDYLAYLAIVLFFMIVAIELYMAIWLPIYLRSKDKWAIQEDRQEMIDLFDGLRGGYRRVKPVSQQGKDEVALIMNCLDNNAIYLRQYQMQLKLDQVMALTKDYQTLAGFLKVYRVKNKKNAKQESSLGKKPQLTTEVFLEQLRRRSAARLNKQIQQYKKNGYIE